MPQVIKIIFFLIILNVIKGCGGGGATTVGIVNSVESYFSIYEPEATSSSKIETTGVKSANTASASLAGYGQASVTLSPTDFEVDNRDCTADGRCRPVIDVCSLPSARGCTEPEPQPSELISYQLYSNIHISDTGAETAWEDGWTGLGQTISIIDDFNNIEIDVRVPVTEDYYLRRRLTHGEVVANIAGGDGTLGPVTEDVAFVYLYSGHYGHRASTTLQKSVGVAKDATVVTNHVDLSNSQNTVNSLNGIVAHLENSNAMSAVNVSIGLDINTVGVSYDELIAEAEESSLMPSTDAVITVAAGNGGAACTRTNLNGCNALGIALAVDPSTNKNTILVGATTGSGLNEAIATYSSRGGMFSNRFLLASGDTGLTKWNGGLVDGTSFAAPRVAGAAAILRHKFPNLSGSDAASILLLTASKDINGDGVKEFAGISSIFGHGKLDLNAALNPVGKLVLKQ